MKTTDKWMPLYLGDYTSGTLRLSTEEHGAYTLLIIDYWINGPPPNKNETLASITKLSVARWKQLRDHLLPFFTIKGGVLRHKRIDLELAKAKSISEKRRKSSLLGVKARNQTVDHLDNQTDNRRYNLRLTPSHK